MRSELFYSPLLLGIAAAGPVVERQAAPACNRDNIFRCILAATTSAVGSKYCGSILQYGTKTVYTSTFTPQATVITPFTVQASTTVTSTITSFATSVQTILATTTTTAQPLQRRGGIHERDETEYLGSRPKEQQQGDQIAKRQAATSPALPCLAAYTNTTSFSARVTSACSCLTSSLGITSATVTTVSTAPTATVTQASTITESPVVSGTTTTSTTLTSTATFTPQPQICGANTKLFRVKAAPGSSMSEQYLQPVVAFAGYTDLNSYFTTDISQAISFCIDPPNRLLFDSKTLNGNGASRINAAFLNSGQTREQMFYNTIDIVNGCSPNCYFIKYHVDEANGNALVADNGNVSTHNQCPQDNHPTYFLATASDATCEKVQPVAEFL